MQLATHSLTVSLRMKSRVKRLVYVLCCILVTVSLCTWSFISFHLVPRHCPVRVIRRFVVRTDHSKTFKEVPPEEVRHIAYLKVHKTASSTMANILMRFGKERNLFFVLPRYKGFLYPNIISLNQTMNAGNVLPALENRGYDILCSHVVYNRTAWRRMMPKDTVYIATVREPFSQFISTLQYFMPKDIMKTQTANSVSSFLQNPDLYHHHNIVGSLINNRMAFEFGFPASLFHDKNITLIRKYLKKLHKEFKLVIISEYFDESMILLKRYLKWNLYDILYLKQNVNIRKTEPERTVDIRANDRNNYRKLAELDYHLYNSFYMRHWRQIREQGFNFYQELFHYKEVQKRLQDFCRNNENEGIPMMHVSLSPWNEEFAVTSAQCHIFRKSEMAMIKEFHRKQYPDIVHPYFD